jgi:hypothetical protein
MMMRAPKVKTILLIAGIILATQAFTLFSWNVPVTASTLPNVPVINELSIIDPDTYDSAKTARSENNVQQTSAFNDFVSSVVNGEVNDIRGIYSENEFAFPVVKQPAGNAGYVSTIEGVVTEFSMAKKYGVTGIVAHNYLAGADFFSLEIGEVIEVVYGDGEILRYKITSIHSYQALSPNSATSQFVDLATSEKISASQLFKRVYMGGQHLTLQTCIQQGTEDSWGRLFVIAEPI